MFSTQNLEIAILNLFQSTKKHVLQPLNGMFLVNDPSLACKVLGEKLFNRKGKRKKVIILRGVFDCVYGAYSFRPFSLQQLMNDEEWEKIRVCNSCLGIHSKLDNTIGIDALGGWNELVFLSKTMTSSFIVENFAMKRREDFLYTSRYLVCNIACRLAFGFDIQEPLFSQIIRGVQDIDEYVKRTSIGSIHNRLKMIEAVRESLRIFKSRRDEISSENSFVASLLSSLEKAQIQFSEEDIVNYICTVLITSFTIQVKMNINSFANRKKRLQT